MATYTPYPPKEHRIPKDDDEWRRFRKEGFDPTHPIPVTFGGSDIGKIFLADRPTKKFKYFMHDKAVRWLGSEAKAKEYLNHLNSETSYSPLYELFLEKASRLSGEEFFKKELVDNNATRVGHAFESHVAWCCEEATGCKINRQPGAYQHGHPDYDFIIANPDGFIDSLKGDFKTIGGDKVTLDGVPCIWEGKTLDPQNTDVVRAWKKYLIPFKYELQVRLYMSTLNVNYALITCGWGFQSQYVANVLVIRDLEIEAFMLERIREFRDSILADSPPSMDGTLKQRMDMIKRDMRRLSNKSTTIMLPASIYGPVVQQMELLEKRKAALSSNLKSLEDQIASCQENLMLGLGSAANGMVVIKDKTYSIKATRCTKETVSKAAVEDIAPGLWDQCKKVSPYVKFSLKREGRR